MRAAYRLNCLIKLALLCAVLIVLNCLSPTLTSAQQGTVPSRRTSPITRDMRYREWMLRDLEKRNKKLNPKEERLALSQINEDFKNLQMVNNNLVATLASSNEFDYRLIAEAMDEIHKRAVRLHTNLVLPEANTDTKRPPNQNDEVQVRTLLSALDGVIMRFIHNPIFKTSGVVDAQLSAKARRDLESVIMLSEKIKKNADKLRKSN